MATPLRAKVKVSELSHVGIVVRDLESSIKHYQNVLGIGPWKVINIEPSTVSNITYHGRPVKHRFKIALTRVGPMQLELLEPVEGDSIYRDFLEEHGEGVHHLGHVRVDNIDEAVQQLEKDGFPCLQSGRFKGGAYAYMDMVASLGTIIELVYRSE